MQALQQWKAAKTRLTEALQHYINCCINLDSAVSHPVSSLPNSTNLPDHIGHEISILDVDAEIQSIKSLDSKLSASHAYVYRLHNMSPSHVPIAILPPEILIHIFSLAMSPATCVSQGYDRMDMIPGLISVCAGWRHLAINTGLLWSHIDVGGQVCDDAQEQWQKLLRLQLTRAGHAPLHLHFQGLSLFRSTDLPKLAQILEPYLDSMASLDLDLEYNSSTLPLQIFQRFAQSCKSGSAKTLTLTSCSFPPHSGMLFSHLYLVKGLVGLHLENLPESVLSSFDQLAGIISENGALRSLRLSKLNILPTDQTRHLESIGLPHLESLDLASLNPQATVWILSILLPGDSELKLRLNPLDSREMILASLRFLRLSKVKALYTFDNSLPCQDWFEKCSPFLQHLRALFLHSDHYLSFVKCDEPTLSSPAPRFPNLQSVYLVEVKFTQPKLKPLQELLNRYPLRKLMLMDCGTGVLQDNTRFLQTFSEYASKMQILYGYYQDAEDEWQSLN